MTIAIDAMGGDFGVKTRVLSSLNVLKTYPNLELLLVGPEPLLKRLLDRARPGKVLHRLHLIHADQVVTMKDLPSYALRNKKQSSMRIAIDLVKGKQAMACVSAGNTGALMAMAHLVLRTLPGIDRAAIISALPTLEGKCRVLDLGANVDSCAEHLLQFAIMGSVLTTAIDGIPSPKVGLLNIGVEEMKGNDQVKRTAQLLAECKYLNYRGYVEGDDIFRGTVDVVVCDGFVGNVALKASEGVARLVKQVMQASFNRSILTKFLGLLTRPVFKDFQTRLDPNQYNGATLIGLQGIVIKSHGSASQQAFACAIIEAMREVERDIPNLIGRQISDILVKGST